ncbi:MAG: DNA pilot protein [Arizlama microvirus]|nr:MAG: DNA pilot protein [Arizlama microvirus]
MAEADSGFNLAGAGSLLSGLASFGGLFGGGGLSARKAAALEFEYNKQVMQNQLQWRAADAEKAGISKHYAMGAPAATFSANIQGGGDSLGSRISQAGQGIQRAAEGYTDSKTRAITTAQQIEMNALDIKNKEIEVAKNASDLAIKQSGATIPLNSNTVIPGQGNAVVNPSEMTAAMRTAPGSEFSPPAPSTKDFIDSNGFVVSYPSKDAKNAIEDNIIYEMDHFYRNRILPALAPAGDWLLRQKTNRNRRIYNYGRW